MGGSDFIVGCVGKPSAGKSTFFNAVTSSAIAKVGAYPFTTIAPNEGMGQLIIDCPCAKYQIQGATCAPRYGKCINGKRHVPIKMLDVAGLLPGAHEGRGLGNQFLDSLRLAHVLLHILDVSGTTNEKGEATVGYDASNDHAWLVEEICLWVFKNLWSKWTSISRRHKATKSTIVVTLSQQLSGYGVGQSMVAHVLEEYGKLKNQNTNEINENNTYLSEDLSEWKHDDIMELVRTFVKIRFPFVLVLNKCDAGGESDNNILKISKRFPQVPMVICSALAECFLQKMEQQKFISYSEGDFTFQTKEDDPSLDLKQMDDKVRNRLEKIKDLVLFRYGSTGVHRALQVAVLDQGGLMPVFPVRSLQLDSPDKKGRSPFTECVIVKKAIMVKELAGTLHSAMERNFLYAEGPDGRRIAEDEIITSENNIIKIVTDRSGI